MRSSILAALAFGLLSVSACENPADSAAKGKVETAKPEAATPKPTAGTETIAITSGSSKINWVGSKVTGKHDGGFKDFSGQITLNAKAPEQSVIKVDIKTDSLFSDSEKLTGHLKSPDFFDVAKYPTATFASTSIKAGGEGGATHTITGNLEMHGIKKSVTFPATVAVAAREVSATAEFAINRKDFGMQYPGMPDDLIREEVVIKLDISGSRVSI